MSLKLSLDLCSRRWLRTSLILERYLLALELWQLKILFGFGRINFRILDLNKLRLFRFWMSELRLFYSDINDGKRIFEEVVFYIKLWNVIRISCSIIKIIFRNNIEEIVRRLFFDNFDKSTTFAVPTSLLKRFQALFLIKLFWRSTSNGSCYCKGCIMLNWLQFLMKRIIVCLVIYGVTVIKMGCNKNFVNR